MEKAGILGQIIKIDAESMRKYFSEEDTPERRKKMLINTSLRRMYCLHVCAGVPTEDAPCRLHPECTCFEGWPFRGEKPIFWCEM